jgi:hypothetical protein
MPVAHCGTPPAPGTFVADATTIHRRATKTNEARLLSPWHHFIKFKAEIGEAGTT